MGDALCYSRNDGALVYKDRGGALVYKGEPPEGGNITVVVVASQKRVGPINGCGNVHDIRVTLDGKTGNGEVSKEFGPGARTIQGSTESVGCSYPQNNPPITINVVASQQTPARVLSASTRLSNVAYGSYQIVVTVGARNVLTGVSVNQVVRR